jgi:hypothetical protein
MRLVGALILIALAFLACQACGVLRPDRKQDYEMITGISITPAHPNPGDWVLVDVTMDSSYIYLNWEGGGPSIHYTVSGGELVSHAYSYNEGPVELRGQDIVTNTTQVQWQLPTTYSNNLAWIKAELPDGAQTLTVPLLAPQVPVPGV